MFGAAVFGSLGGWMGARVGMMTGYFAGMLGTAFGFYLARRFSPGRMSLGTTNIGSPVHRCRAEIRLATQLIQHS